MREVGVLAMFLAWGGSLLAQGTVEFKNSRSSEVSNSVTMNRVIGGTSFSIALYYLPDQAVTPSPWDFDERGTILLPHAHFQGSSTVASGVFQGGVRSTPSTTPPGGLAWFQVRVWETAFGATYEEAVQQPGALTGTSNIFRTGTVNPTQIPPPDHYPPWGLQSFYVGVPEPSTLALGALGFLALFFLSRRKQHSRPDLPNAGIDRHE